MESVSRVIKVKLRESRIALMPGVPGSLVGTVERMMHDTVHELARQREEATPGYIVANLYTEFVRPYFFHTKEQALAVRDNLNDAHKSRDWAVYPLGIPAEPAPQSYEHTGFEAGAL